MNSDQALPALGASFSSPFSTFFNTACLRPHQTRLRLRTGAQCSLRSAAALSLPKCALLLLGALVWAMSGGALLLRRVEVFSAFALVMAVFMLAKFNQANDKRAWDRAFNTTAPFVYR